MNKEQVYHKIDSFITKVKDEKEIKTNKYYFVDSNEATEKANFINFLINNKNNTLLKQKVTQVDTVLDLAFGSGNLTSHILLDNGIKYNKLILNDKFIEDCNKSIKTDLDNCELKQCDFFDSNCFDENSVDLLIFNPTHGGKPTKKDFVYKNNKNFDKLNETLSKILRPNAMVIFRGWEDDFKELMFSDFKYKKILLDENQSLYVCYDIETKETECYEYKDNDFIKNEKCQKKQENEEEDLEIQKLVDKLNSLNLSDTDKNALLCSENYKNKQLKFSNVKKGNIDFSYKNLLLKGVPGTGKSHIIEEIINKDLKLKENPKNVCRINIHSASSNADLMQGIGINSNGGNIEYKEKQGLIYNHIKKALFVPNQPFVLVLEEIQENSLNELIGDLIYLIEEKKRVTVDAEKFEDGQEYEYQAFIEEILEDDENEHYIEIPYLVDTSTSYRKMVLPSNLYIFCTSNYRDDKKVIEDNLLRRFDVVEIYPKYYNESWKNEKDKLVFKAKDVSEFLEWLNSKILEKFDSEIHPDRYLVGHANWLDITEDDTEKNKKLFYTALLKVIVEFKEIREVDFNTYTEEILKEVFTDSELSDRIKSYIEDCDFKYTSYKEMVKKLQKKIYGFLK